MSYILEALKKSESERNQGRVPDLGQQIRMVHRKRKRGIPAAAWLAIALVFNAIVLAALFWPGVGLWQNDPDTATGGGAAAPVTDIIDAPGAHQAASGEVSPEGQDLIQTPEITAATGEPGIVGVNGAGEDEALVNSAETEDDGLVVLDTVDEAPTVIIPTVRPTVAEGGAEGYTPAPWEGRVPHLVEMPMAFQRQVPDLVFNSHVYSPRPMARSVMINSRYLRMGDTLGPLRVERITEDGVELSMDGERFRVGVVRDWSSPR